MSGIEVVGLVLGAIPLIIEGFNRSQKAFAAFNTYRHYPKELTKLDAKIVAQKTVFRNNCINMLTTLTNDRQMVLSMLSDTSHMGWQDENFQSTLAVKVDALDESFMSCQRTMDQIRYALRDICRETEAFRNVLMATNEEETKAVGNREWCKRLGKRIKLSLNKPKIETHIEELRNFNSDFNLMSNQIINSIKDTTVRSATGVNQLSRTLPSLLKYQSVRKASQWLYETLVNRWSCSLHSSHSANISLKGAVDDLSSIRVSRPAGFSTVRFEMAVTYFAGSMSDGHVPIWLEIESTVDLISIPQMVPALQKFQKISNALESRTGSYVAETKPRKSVRFNQNSPDGMDVSAPQSTPASSTVEAGSSALSQGSLDLCLIQDVCEHFQNHQRQSQQEICMRYLEDSCVQRFYQPPAEKRLEGSTKSLEDIIVWISEDPIRILPRSIMFQLAFSLATAVLRYHSTPWLSEAWGSSDVVFFGINDLQQGDVSLRNPHLNAEFSRYKGKGKVTIDPESDIMSGVSTSLKGLSLQNARNEVLFRLGVIFLEVGFATPWKTLRESMLKTLPADATDYTIADKLARVLVNSMGPGYSKIVRKCLGCDFGLGETDLASDELQERFLMDVVLALQGLEQRFPVT